MTSLDDVNACLCLCHIEKPPDSKLYRCGTCEELLCCKCLWQAHNVAHKNDTRYVCNICGKAYHYRSDLKRHLTVHDSIKPHKCEVCHKCFNQVGHLMTHRLTHTGEKPFLCDICSKAFNRKSNLLKHKLVHSGDRPFVCEECNSTFTRKGDLGRHRLLHTGEKPYACTLCDKAFTQKPHLVNHQVVHTGIKPFVCDCCDKSFNRKSNLVKHQKCHFKEVPGIRKDPYFTCEHCNATFFDQTALEEHREEHGNTDLFSCSMCDKSFSHKPLLISHQGTHHDVQPFTCNWCDKTFNSMIFFRKHQSAHVKRLINKKDPNLIFKTVHLSENVVSVKEEPMEDPLDDANLLTEESCSSQLPANSESSIDCDDTMTFIGVADLLRGVHTPITETLACATSKKAKSNFILPDKDRSQSNENFSSENCSSSSEDSQFRLLNALQLQINYNKPSKDTRLKGKNNKCSFESSIADKTHLTSDQTSTETITSNGLTSISKTVTPTSNVPEEEQSGQILRKILSAAEPIDKNNRNKVIESKQCNNGENQTWNSVPVNKSELES